MTNLANLKFPDQLLLTPLDQRDWLTAKELAARFGLNEDSAYRWRAELIPDEHPKTKRVLVRYAGTARIYFHLDCVSFLADKFAAAHD